MDSAHPGESVALSPQEAEGLKRFAALLDEGNRPLSLLCSLTSRLKLDPHTGALPYGLFYRGLSEVVYSRYGLKGTIRRAFMGEPLSALAVNFFMCASNVDRHAEQTEPLLQWLRGEAHPEAAGMLDTMLDLFRQERANFRQAVEFLENLLGHEAWEEAEHEVIEATGVPGY